MSRLPQLCLDWPQHAEYIQPQNNLIMIPEGNMYLSIT